MDVETGEELFAFATEGAPFRVAFSPDDERILVGGQPAFVLDAGTGAS